MMLALHPEPPVDSHAHSPAGGHLVAADGRALPLREASVHVLARGGLARVVLVQRFHNPHHEPLLVQYLLPLPESGAASGFSFRIGEERITGEVDRIRRARERFEEALVSGRAAAIVEQKRSNLFNQEVGNIPPGCEVECELIVDQPLEWLPEGAWEWRFPTVVGPRYMGARGRVPDAAAIAVPVSTGELSVRMGLELEIGDVLADAGAVSSPSHALDIRNDSVGQRVRFRSAGGARLDRDIVIRWPVAMPEVGLSLDAARPSSEMHEGSAYGLLTIVPPAPGAKFNEVPRDLIVLLDTSGSMGGEPLAHAKRIVCALIDGLGERDRLEMIEFSNHPRRFRNEPLVATRDGKQAACKWIKGLQAGGATEMKAGILEALRTLRPRSQRQVLLITDGQIGFEQEIIETIVKRLPAGCRLHTVGVGSSVNRALLRPAARAGGGAGVVVGIGENPERAILELGRRMGRPILTDLRIEGGGVQRTVPIRLPDLHAGAPALIGLELEPSGGRVRVTGTTPDGEWSAELVAPALALGEGNQAVSALYGREWVEDLETRLAAGANPREVDSQIEKAGIAFQISTRLTSWIAVSDEPVNRTGKLVREEMPHELPHGVSLAGLGLRAPAGRKGGAVSGLPDEFEVRDIFEEIASEGIAGADLHALKGLLSRHDLPEERGTARPSPPAAMPPAKAKGGIDLKARLGKGVPSIPLVFSPPPRAPETPEPPAPAAYQTLKGEVEEEVASRQMGRRPRWALVLLLVILLIAVCAGLWRACSYSSTSGRFPGASPPAMEMAPPHTNVPETPA